MRFPPLLQQCDIQYPSHPVDGTARAPVPKTIARWHFGRRRGEQPDIFRIGCWPWVGRCGWGGFSQRKRKGSTFFGCWLVGVLLLVPQLPSGNPPNHCRGLFCQSVSAAPVAGPLRFSFSFFNGWPLFWCVRVTIEASLFRTKADSQKPAAWRQRALGLVSDQFFGEPLPFHKCRFLWPFVYAFFVQAAYSLRLWRSVTFNSGHLLVQINFFFQKSCASPPCNITAKQLVLPP